MSKYIVLFDRYRKISGDKCVQGEETFYLPQIQDCPVEAPGNIKLYVKDSEYTKVIGEEFNFHFTQGNVSYLQMYMYITYLYFACVHRICSVSSLPRPHIQCMSSDIIFSPPLPSLSIIQPLIGGPNIYYLPMVIR